MNVKTECKRCGMSAEIEGNNLTGENFLILLSAFGWEINGQETICPRCKQIEEMRIQNAIRNGWDEA